MSDDELKPPTHFATFSPDEVRHMILQALASKHIAVPFGRGMKVDMTIELHDDGTMNVAASFYEGKKVTALRVIRGGKTERGHMKCEGVLVTSTGYQACGREGTVEVKKPHSHYPQQQISHWYCSACAGSGRRSER